MQKIRELFLLGLVILMFIAYGVRGDAQPFTEEELATQRVQDKINSLEKSMATMQQELYRNNNSNSKGRGKQPVNEEPIGIEEERTRATNGKIEELEHNVSTLAAKLDKIISDIDLRLAALENKSKTDPAQETKPVDATDGDKIIDKDQELKHDAQGEVKPETGKPGAEVKDDTATQYDKALALFRLSKYEEAEQAFRDFIVNNKNGDLTGNAYYWLGETYYSRKNYQQAAVNFLKGYQDFPKGNKAADSLFKLATSLKGMKKEKEACATLGKIKKEYPASDKDLLAKTGAERTALKCN